jgi:hypothetical protein
MIRPTDAERKSQTVLGWPWLRNAARRSGVHVHIEDLVSRSVILLRNHAHIHMQLHTHTRAHKRLREREREIVRGRRHPQCMDSPE